MHIVISGQFSRPEKMLSSGLGEVTFPGTHDAEMFFVTCARRHFISLRM